MKKQKQIVTTESKLAKAFEQWLADYQKDPASFGSIEAMKPITYGRRCAKHLIERLK